MTIDFAAELSALRAQTAALKSKISNLERNMEVGPASLTRAGLLVGLQTGTKTDFPGEIWQVRSAVARRVLDLGDFNPTAAPTSFTPSFTNFTLGNGTVTIADFYIVGRLLFFRLSVTLGSTSAVAGSISFNAPHGGTTFPVLGQAGGEAVVGGLTYQVAFNSFTGTINLRLISRPGTYSTFVPMSASAPGIWTTGDSFSLAGRLQINSF